VAAQFLAEHLADISAKPIYGNRPMERINRLGRLVRIDQPCLDLIQRQGRIIQMIFDVAV
jgi:hypothetical protein